MTSSYGLPRSEQETRRGRQQGRDLLENFEISLNVADVLRVIPEDERHQHDRRPVCVRSHSCGCRCRCSCASLCRPPIPSFAAICASASASPTLALCPTIVAAARGSSRPRPRMGASQGNAAVSRSQSFEAVLAVQQVCVLAIHHRGKPHVADPRVPLHCLQHQLQLRKGVYKRPVVLRNQCIRRRHLLEPSLRPSAGCTVRGQHSRPRQPVGAARVSACMHAGGRAAHASPPDGRVP